MSQKEFKFRCTKVDTITPELFSDVGVEYIRKRMGSIWFNYAFNIQPQDSSIPIKQVTITNQFRIFLPDQPYHHFLTIISTFELDTEHFTLNTSQVYAFFKRHFKESQKVLMHLKYPHPYPNHYYQGVMA